MTAKSDLIDHLKTGATTTCRTWKVTRRDGRIFGFTDHDRDLAFEDVIFKANSGLTAGALQQTSGFAVDNTEVVGSLSADAISEVDLMAGRFDDAEVVIWLVNWSDTEQRVIRFRGYFGEIQITEGSFRVELRGLTDKLNSSKGRVLQPSCPAALGDRECRIDLSLPAYSVETTIKAIGRPGEYHLQSQAGFPDGWFAWGRMELTSGGAVGLSAVVNLDVESDGLRKIQTPIDFRLRPEVGDSLRIRAGCDKMPDTCRGKFSNFLNFRGFPHVPGTDWMASYPATNLPNDGGSRYK